MSYKDWRSNSRRDRRRKGEFRRGTPKSTDRTFLLVAGLFFFVLILILAVLALLSSG